MSMKKKKKKFSGVEHEICFLRGKKMLGELLTFELELTILFEIHYEIKNGNSICKNSMA